MQQIDMARGEELIGIVVRSISDVELLINEIGEGMRSCADLIRKGQDKELYQSLTGEIMNLHNLFDFVSAVRESLDTLEHYGIEIDDAPLAPWNRSTDILRQALDAFERKDFILFADLVEYELLELLKDGLQGLKEIKRFLEEI